MNYIGTIIGEIDGAVDIGGEWWEIISPLTNLQRRCYNVPLQNQLARIKILNGMMRNQCIY